MYSKKVNIFGSCVTRDAIGFAQGLTVDKYCARQSLVSSVAAAPGPALLAAVQFAEGTHDFHRRCVQEDLEKSTLDLLAARPADELVIIDFIEERVPLAETADGTIFTFSQAVTSFTNARSIARRLVQAYSDDYVSRFHQSVEEFVRRLAGRPVVVHRALYAPGDWDWQRANRVLEGFYDALLSRLAPVAVIDVPEDLRVSSPGHKWGVAPYHYVDDYYRAFVAQWADRVQADVGVREDVSLQKAA